LRPVAPPAARTAPRSTGAIADEFEACADASPKICGQQSGLPVGRL
jgi:alpha-ketoglutaric semialdehyde dehydrogenase